MLIGLPVQVAAYNCVSRFLVALDGELFGRFLHSGRTLICWQLERRMASSLEAPIRSDISHSYRILNGPRLLCMEQYIDCSSLKVLTVLCCVMLVCVFCRERTMRLQYETPDPNVKRGI